jgi:hypothetical protein
MIVASVRPQNAEPIALENGLSNTTTVIVVDRFHGIIEYDQRAAAADARCEKDRQSQTTNVVFTEYRQGIAERVGNQQGQARLFRTKGDGWRRLVLTLAAVRHKVLEIFVSLWE